MDRVKKKTMAQLKLPGLTIVYIIFICIIFVSISAIPSIFNQKETKRSMQVIQQIEQALQVNTQQEKITKLKQTTDIDGVDLVVIQQNEALYATLPVQGFDSLDKIVEKRSLVYGAVFQSSSSLNCINKIMAMLPNMYQISCIFTQYNECVTA